MRFVRGLVCLLVASVVWVESVHLWFEQAPEVVARPLAARQLELWERGGPELEAILAELRHTNPEWDLMARTFTVLAFANLALREPPMQARYLASIDDIIERTIEDAEQHGPHYFLLPYSKRQPFIDRAARSVFVDGEIAVMIAARQLVERDPRRRSLARVWIERVIRELERGPVLLAESYPDEVWLFCNSVALAAVRLHDASEGAPDRHAALFSQWVMTARQTVVDPTTQLLAAKTSYRGEILEGPEGSTLWLVAAMLRVIDDDFARDQYARTRAALRGGFAGFGWAREWPASWPGTDDVDSGPTVPLVGANAGSSGLALVGARAFGDEAFTRELLTSLGLAGFPVAAAGGVHYAAGNQLADSVLLYALASGPLWERAMGGAR